MLCLAEREKMNYFCEKHTLQRNRLTAKITFELLPRNGLKRVEGKEP